MAMLELIPLLVIFVILINFGVGFWAVVHTGMLHSIGARNYAFETLRHRASYNYLRAYQSIPGCVQYYSAGFRFHAVTDDNGSSDDMTATARRLSMVQPPPKVGDAPSDHLKVYEIEGQNRNVKLSPIWVKVGYGICLRASCSGQ